MRRLLICLVALMGCADLKDGATANDAPAAARSAPGPLRTEPALEEMNLQRAQATSGTTTLLPATKKPATRRTDRAPAPDLPDDANADRGEMAREMARRVDNEAVSALGNLFGDRVGEAPVELLEEGEEIEAEEQDAERRVFENEKKADKRRSRRLLRKPSPKRAEADEAFEPLNGQIGAKGKNEKQRRSRGKSALASSVSDKASLNLLANDDADDDADGGQLDDVTLAVGDQIARPARIRPRYRDGRVSGYAIAGVTAGSDLEKLGLKSGDVMVAVDGKPIAGANQALAFHQRIGSGETTIEIERGGLRRFVRVSRDTNGLHAREVDGTDGLHAERWRIADDAWLDRPGVAEKPARFLPRMFYFENTYLGRTAAFQERLRRLDASLGQHAFDATPLEPQRLDPPSDAGLALTTALDRQHLDAPGRVILQVALQGSQRYGWRRPPLDLAVVLDPLAVARDPAASRALLDRLVERLGPKDRLGVVLATDPPQVLVDVQDVRTAQAAILALDGSVRTGGVAVAQGMRRAGARLLAASEGQARVPGSQTLVVFTAGQQSPDAAARAAHDLTVQGAVTSIIDQGGGWRWWAVANAGHGQLYSGSDMRAAVDGELERLSKVVARLLRVNIKLADGVEAVRVLGSRMLDDDEVKAVKAREVATDRQISKTMGVKADRGDDDDGIQTVIPFFHGGDAHVILVELWVDKARRSMPVAEVTLRYKDMVALTNATARSHVSLASLRQETTPAELLVRRNVRGFELAEALGRASTRVARGDEAGARRILDAAIAGSARDRRLISALKGLLAQGVDRAVKRAALAYAGQRRISHVASQRR